jgi:predicted ATPase
MADGITRIAVEGFKSISKRQSIDIAPLTILAGTNSSGKSSIMQPLLMLKQTLEEPYDPGPLLISGAAPNVKFTAADQFLSRNTPNPRGKLTVEIALERGAEFHVAFQKSESGVQVIEQKDLSRNATFILRPHMTVQEIAKNLQQPGLLQLQDVR